MSARERRLAPRQRDALIEEISASCARFMADLAAVVAGMPDELESYVDPACTAALRYDFGALDAVLVPDFGEWAQLTIEGPLSISQPTVAHIDFTDATTATDRAGRPLRVVPREIRVSLVIDPVTMRVADVAFAALS